MVRAEKIGREEGAYVKGRCEEGARRKCDERYNN